jgi:hypothetical protein
MAKLRIKVSGCIRSMKGAENFCAIRSYLATAGRHGIGWLEALTRAASGQRLDPPDRINPTGNKAPRTPTQTGTYPVTEELPSTAEMFRAEAQQTAA